MDDLYRLMEPPLGDEFLINSTTGNHQTTSAIAYNDEAYLTCWTSSGGQDGDGSGIYGQLLDETGAKIGSEFRVNHSIDGDQQTVSITTLGKTFFITWQGQSPDTSFDIYGTLFDADNPHTFAYLTDAAADASFGEDWDLTEMNDLYHLYKSQLSSVVIDGETWYYSNRDWGQSYSTGDYWVDGEYKYMYLDGFQGLTTQFVPVPEPVTIILFGLSLVSFIRYKKK